MNSFVFHSLGTPLGVPLVSSRKKNIAPLVAAAGISGLASLASGIGNLFGQHSANKANLQAVRETNEANYKIAQETNQANKDIHAADNAFNLDMFNRTNAYNSPEAVKQRLLAAGINPAGVLGNNMPTPASSIGSASPIAMESAQMQAGQVQPLNFDSIAQGADSAINAYFGSIQADKIAADTRGQNIKNAQEQFNLDHQYQVFINDMTEKLANIANIKAKTESEKALKAKLEREVNEMIDTFAERKKSIQLQNKNTERSTKAIDENIELEKERNRINKRLAAVQERLASVQEKLGDANVQQIMASVKNLTEDYIQLRAKRGANVQKAFVELGAVKLENTYKSLLNSGLKREQAVANILDALAIDEATLRNDAPIRRLCLKVFGMSPDELFKSAASVTTAGAAAKVAGVKAASAAKH